MKNTWIPGLALLVALAGFAFSGQESVSKAGQDGGDVPPKSQIEVLTEDLSKTKLELQQLRASLVDMQSSHEQLLSWAESQAKAAAVMQSTLNASEAAGFTAGINPNSRQLLLSGWRDALRATQSGVPEAPRRSGQKAGKKPLK